MLGQDKNGWVWRGWRFGLTSTGTEVCHEHGRLWTVPSMAERPAPPGQRFSSLLSASHKALNFQMQDPCSSRYTRGVPHPPSARPLLNTEANSNAMWGYPWLSSNYLLKIILKHWQLINKNKLLLTQLTTEPSALWVTPWLRDTTVTIRQQQAPMAPGTGTVPHTHYPGVTFTRTLGSTLLTLLFYKCRHGDF